MVGNGVRLRNACNSSLISCLDWCCCWSEISLKTRCSPLSTPKVWLSWSRGQTVHTVHTPHSLPLYSLPPMPALVTRVECDSVWSVDTAAVSGVVPPVVPGQWSLSATPLLLPLLCWTRLILLCCHDSLPALIITLESNNNIYLSHSRLVSLLRLSPSLSEIIIQHLTGIRVTGAANFSNFHFDKYFYFHHCCCFIVRTRYYCCVFFSASKLCHRHRQDTHAVTDLIASFW